MDGRIPAVLNSNAAKRPPSCGIRAFAGEGSAHADDRLREKGARQGEDEARVPASCLTTRGAVGHRDAGMLAEPLAEVLPSVKEPIA